MLAQDGQSRIETYLGTYSTIKKAHAGLMETLQTAQADGYVRIDRLRPIEAINRPPLTISQLPLYATTWQYPGFSFTVSFEILHALLDPSNDTQVVFSDTEQ